MFIMRGVHLNVVRMQPGPTEEGCPVPFGCTYPAMLNTSGVVPRFRAMVTNTGDEALTSIRITHTLFPAWTFATFAKGATANKTYDTTWRPGEVINTATSTATSAVTNTAVTSQHQASFFGAQPSLRTTFKLEDGPSEGPIVSGREAVWGSTAVNLLASTCRVCGRI
jgi:hypothetical protein